MILRQAKFKVSGMMLFNAGVGLFLLTTAGVSLRYMFVKEPTAVCAVRYQNAMVYPWSRAGGEAFSAPDLQAKLGGFDWGVLDNVRFVENAPVLSRVAIEVGLPKDGPRPAGAAPAVKKSGMGFAWQPSRIKDASYACLGYNVFVPADTDLGTGITLPGLFGNEDSEPLGDRNPAFSTRMRWREDSRLEVNVTQDNGFVSHQVDPQRTKLERGRWVRIEQEVALNSPGRRDGLLRVWVNGELKLELNNMTFRQEGSDGFRGIDASVHYSRPNHAWAPSPKDGVVRLSPFEIRWH